MHGQALTRLIQYSLGITHCFFDLRIDFMFMFMFTFRGQAKILERHVLLAYVGVHSKFFKDLLL